MAGSSPRSASWWIVIATALTVLAGILLVPDEWLREQMISERAANQAFFSAHGNERIEARALKWFDRTFVRTGLMERAYSGVMTHEDGDDRAGAEVSSRLNEWVASRADVLWMLVLMVLLRLSVAVTWFPLLILVAAGFLNDAWVSRRIKAASFGGTSPHGFHYAQIIVRHVPLLVLFLFVAPVHLPAELPPVLILVLGLASWTAVSQFAKRA